MRNSHLQTDAALLPETLRPLNDDDAEAFAGLCERDPVRLLTPRLNIENFGFAGDRLRTWGVFAADGETLLGIMLRFNNTLVAVDLDGDCGPLFAQHIDAERGIAGVRGTRETVLAIRNALQYYKPAQWEESLYLHLQRPPDCPPERLAFARRATLSDLDKLALLYSGAGTMYRSRANVATKLEAQSRVFVVEATMAGWRSSRFVSCALLNVEGREAGLIGGVYTLPEMRGRGYAAACTAALALDLQRDGKLPCLFYENPIAGRVYRNLGFTQVGTWAVQYLTPNRRA